jgi:hypothetical protein
MAETNIKSAIRSQDVPSRNAFETILASATDAFGSAVVLWILGGVAINIAGSFAGQMVPTLPPGFERLPAAQDHPWWHTAPSGGFTFCFAIFFIHSLWVGFHGQGAGAGKRIGRILSHLRENWFGLMVGNAIGAWVTVTVLSHLPSFSPFQMLWHWFLGWALPSLRAIAIFVLGASNTASVSDWFSWYNSNQIKLNFWVLYLAGAFDDLGVPNVKAMARWSWRRFQEPKPATSPASIE